MGGIQIFVKEDEDTKARNARLQELKAHPELHTEKDNKYV